MAEAAVEEQPDRFFCHTCKVEIIPTLPDYTCPRCDNGFIEAIDEIGPLEDPEEHRTQTVLSGMDPASQFAELWGRTFLDSLHMRTNRQNERPNDSDNSDDSEAEAYNQITSGIEPDLSTLGDPFPGTRLFFRRMGGQRAGRHPAVESIVQQLLSGMTGGAMFGRAGLPANTMFSLYGNPGDYAWGAGGLDHIISQLLNQLDGTGPPPAAKDQIEGLPSVNITQEQIDKNMQCSVCMEDFKLAELVRRLPCNHHYHSDCITPWLELHGTCPVCRKNLLGEDTSTGPPTGTEPQPTNLSENHVGSSSDASSSQQDASSTSQSGRNLSRFDFIDEYD